MTKTTSSLDLSVGDDSAIAGFVGDRFAVDGRNDRGLAETDLVGEGAGTNAGDDHAALDAGLCRDRGRDG